MQRSLTGLVLATLFLTGCAIGPGPQKSGMYHDFYDAITRAEGAASVQWLAKIEKAASDGNWQAAAWKLERRFPHEYGRRVHELQGSEDAPVVFTLRLGDREMTDGTDSE